MIRLYDCKFAIDAYNFRRILYSVEPPKERPKLNLTKRSEKTENIGESDVTTKTSSIFGGAKPVDTAKKEAEIELKLQVIIYHILS